MSVVKYPNIEAERARRGLTQNELSEKVGCSHKTYWNWQNGCTPIPADKLVTIADLFGVSTDYILGRST